MVNPGAGHWGWGSGHQSIPASAGEMGEAADRALPPPGAAAGATGSTYLSSGLSRTQKGCRGA